MRCHGLFRWVRALKVTLKAITRPCRWDTGGNLLLEILQRLSSSQAVFKTRCSHWYICYFISYIRFHLRASTCQSLAWSHQVAKSMEELFRQRKTWKKNELGPNLRFLYNKETIISRSSGEMGGAQLTGLWYRAPWQSHLWIPTSAPMGFKVSQYLMLTQTLTLKIIP